MFKVGILVWIVLATTLAGLAVTVVLVVPSLNAQAMKFIPIAALAGTIVAIPLSLMIAKRLTATAGR
jgi:hypothetical protein